MQIWSEFSWSYASTLVMLLYVFGPLAIFGFACYKLKKSRGPWGAISAALLLLWFFLGGLSSGHQSKNDPYWGLAGRYSLSAWEERANIRLAVVDNKTQGSIVAYNLVAAEIMPWPIPTRYSIVRYPARLSFWINFQPITRNPKVVPLTVQVTVSIPMDANPQFLADYILHQERQRLDEQIFKRYAFDLLQHKLPQEITDRLNPFDDASMAAFKEFVAKELNPYLVQHKVTDVTVALK